MSNIEDRMTKLLDFPYGSYLMLRLEYVLICETELEAKIMRLIEMYMENERRKLLQEYLNNQKNNAPKDQIIDITKNVWASISHRLFSYDLYDLVKSENTLKQAIKSLQKKNFIRVKFEQVNRYDTPQYQINTEVVQEELNKLKQQGKSGYQKLTPSKIDTLKNRYPQKLTPSEDQKLIPSKNNLSSDEELRVSKIDTNSRSNNISKIITEECSKVDAAHAGITSASSSTSLSEKNEAKENPTPEPTTEQGVTPPTKKGTAARRSVGAKAKDVKEEKTITLTPDAQLVYEEWCKMPWFKVKPALTETLAAHCETAKHYKPTAEIMLKVKNDATSAKNDKNGFYKGKGWNFKFMLNELPQWLAMNDPACNGGSPSTPPSQQTTQDDEQKFVAWTRTGQWDGNPLENWQQFELMTKKEAKILGWTSDALPGVIHNKIMIQLRKQADQQHRQQATA